MNMKEKEMSNKILKIMFNLQIIMLLQKHKYLMMIIIIFHLKQKNKMKLQNKLNIKKMKNLV